MEVEAVMALRVRQQQPEVVEPHLAGTSTSMAAEVVLLLELPLPLMRQAVARLVGTELGIHPVLAAQPLVEQVAGLVLAVPLVLFRAQPTYQAAAVRALLHLPTAPLGVLQYPQQLARMCHLCQLWRTVLVVPATLAAVVVRQRTVKQQAQR
jgi:hypothetical protein